MMHDNEPASCVTAGLDKKLALLCGPPVRLIQRGKHPSTPRSDLEAQGALLYGHLGSFHLSPAGPWSVARRSPRCPCYHTLQTVAHDASPSCTVGYVLASESERLGRAGLRLLVASLPSGLESRLRSPRCPADPSALAAQELRARCTY